MKKRSPGILLVFITGLPGLTSCTMTGKEYVDESVGYAITRGEVVRFSNLYTERTEHLKDGVAIMVFKPGFVVDFRLGERIQVIDAVPGSILVLSRSDDFLLQPYGPAEMRKPPGLKGVEGKTAAPDAVPAKPGGESGSTPLRDR